MSKIMELRSKRNTLWEQTKAFLEKHRGENGLVEASAVEQYNKMAGEVQALGAEIERLEQQAALDAALSAPTSKPVTNAPRRTDCRQDRTDCHGRVQVRILGYDPQQGRSACSPQRTLCRRGHRGRLHCT